MKKILIVEDDENIAMALQIRVKAAGYEVSLAYDALIGVNLAVKNRPDLVLLDISMPGGSGFSVAEAIKAKYPSAPPPVLYLTASKRPELRQKAEQFGAAGFFEKPYDAEQLLVAIREALGNEATLPA